MAKFNFRVEGKDKAIAILKSARELAPHLIMQELEKSGFRIEADAKKNCAVDMGGTRASIQARAVSTTNGPAVEVSCAKTGLYLEFGTRPHMPPVESIKAWAVRHGIPESAAYAIALHIKQYGTPAQPFMFPAYEAERPEFIRNVGKAVVQAFRQRSAA